MDCRFLTSQLFGETEHLSFHSQFYDEAGVGPSAAPYILPSWLRWKNFYRILAKMAPQLLQSKHKEEHGNRSKSKPKEGWEER